MKVLFVRNLSNGVTEELLEQTFREYGILERVKKLKDYAFIHFEDRDGAVKVGSASHTTRSVLLIVYYPLICAHSIIQSLAML